MSEELQKLLDQVHQGITIFDFDGKPVPCIIFEEKKYDELLSKISGKSLSVNTDLNILQDGLGHVFVEVMLAFSQGGLVEKILVYANKDILFFESLAKTSMIAISSPKSSYGKDNVFMIQLPKPEKAADALEIIQNGLKQTSDR
ncbi:MAG: hypothetical protein OEL77_03815 [Nitrosopumilus sp.]|nr:hypothetical protein [Nitrosopumilus sp.]MDH3385124.1 hypothetical protein [Nitrosopumilus sp.]